MKVNAKTGQLADGEGSGVILEAFKQGTEPRLTSSTPGVSLFGNVPLSENSLEGGPMEGAVLDGGTALPPDMMEMEGTPSTDGLRGPDGEALPFGVAVPEGGVPTEKIPGINEPQPAREGGYSSGGNSSNIGSGTGGLY